MPLAPQYVWHQYCVYMMSPTNSSKFNLRSEHSQHTPPSVGIRVPITIHRSITHMPKRKYAALNTSFPGFDCQDR